MRRWQDYSKDPNAPELMALRQQAVSLARSGRLVGDRIAYICELVRGKSVLDIGVIEHTAGAMDHPAWLHGNIRRHAAHCLGVDVLEPEVAALAARGYDVICADISREPLARKFDIIIAGEVIEHLGEPGGLMQNCAAMLEPGGRLVITTPNPWYANAIIKSLSGSTVMVDSVDHVAWYDASVLYELGQRHGLRLERYSGVGGTRAETWRAALFFRMRPLLTALGLGSELFAKSIIYEFVRHCD